jgi:hypothetical protein
VCLLLNLLKLFFNEVYKIGFSFLSPKPQEKKKKNFVCCAPRFSSLARLFGGFGNESENEKIKKRK